MTTVKISGATASAAEREVYTSGTVGAALRFEFDGAWDGLAKTAVFRFGSVTYDVPESEWTDGECVIPHECLAASGDELMCGVYGVSQDGETVIPTVWVRLGYVQSGADPSGDESTAPTLPVWAALKNAIGDLGDLDTTAKNTLVAAINEAAQNGGTSVTALIGTTAELTPSQVQDAVLAGRSVAVQYTDSEFGVLKFTNFNIAASENLLASAAAIELDGVWVVYALYGNTSTQQWETKVTQMATTPQVNTISTRVSTLENAGYLTLATLPKYGGESE